VVPHLVHAADGSILQQADACLLVDGWIFGSVVAGIRVHGDRSQPGDFVWDGVGVYNVQCVGI